MMKRDVLKAVCFHCGTSGKGAGVETGGPQRVPEQIIVIFLYFFKIIVVFLDLAHFLLI
jgi:hypothetical protein